MPGPAIPIRKPPSSDPPTGFAVGGEAVAGGLWRRSERRAVLDWEAKNAFHAAYERPSCRSKEDVA